MAKFDGRHVRSVLSRLAGHIFLGIMFIIAAVDCSRFDSFSTPTKAEMRRVSAAVVFTGQFGRVDIGLELVDAGDVPHLFISGVNAGAGILPGNFVKQFSARSPDIQNFARLIDCCVEWGERAENTIQNAQETKCWIDSRRLNGTLLLITSRRHMARALAALSGTLQDQEILPYPVNEAGPLAGSMRLREYLNYLITITVVRLPMFVGGRRIYGPFAESCPEAF